MNLNQSQTESLQALFQKIKNVYPTPCYTLQARNQIEKLNNDARLLCQCIEELLSADEITDAFLEDIKGFLSNRWSQIKNNPALRYDTAFYIPLNQFISEFCEHIKHLLACSKYELMNSELQNTTDIATFCEVDEFMLHQILFCGDAPNNNFIDLPECLKWSAHKENQLHQLLHNNLPGRPELSTQALNLISKRDQWSSDYISSLKKLQESLGKLKFYNELIKLSQGLEKGDRDHDQAEGGGDETHAGKAAEKAQERFITYYFNELTEEQRNEFDKLSFNPDGEYFLLSELNTFEKIKHRLAGNVQSKIDDDSMYCVQFMGDALEVILHENIDKLIDKNARQLISDTQEKLNQLIEINNILNDIITAFLGCDNELIINLFTNYLQSPSDKNTFLLNVMLRSSILYQNHDVLQALVTQASNSDSFEFTGGFLKDLLLYIPTTILINVLQHIDVVRQSDSGYSFLLLAVISNRVDLIRYLLEQNPDLPWVQITPRPQDQSYHCQLIEHCIDRGQAEMVSCFLYNASDTDITTAPNRNKIKSLYNRALNNRKPDVLLAITTYIKKFPRSSFQPCFELFNFREQLEWIINQNNTDLLRPVLSVIRPDEITKIIEAAIEHGKANILMHALDGDPYIDYQEFFEPINRRQNHPSLLFIVAYNEGITLEQLQANLATDLRNNPGKYSQLEIEEDSLISQIENNNKLNIRLFSRLLSCYKNSKIIIYQAFSKPMLIDCHRNQSTEEPPIFIYYDYGHYFNLTKKDNVTLTTIYDQIEHPQRTNQLIDLNAILQGKNKGETLLTCAIKRSRAPTEIVRCLINSGADVNRPSLIENLLRKPLRSYPLIDAANKNDRKTVNLLLNHGADESVTDYNDKTYREYLNEQPNLEGEDLSFEINQDPFLSCR